MKGARSRKAVPFSSLPFTQQNTPVVQKEPVVKKQKPISLERSSSQARSKRSTEQFTTWLTCRHTNIDIRKKLMEACKSPIYRRSDLKIDRSFEPEEDIETNPRPSINNELAEAVEQLRSAITEIDSQLIQQRRDRQLQIAKACEKLEKLSRRESLTAATAAKEECLEFIREYVVEASNTLTAAHQKDKKTHLEYVTVRCQQEYSRLKEQLKEEVLRYFGRSTEAVIHEKQQLQNLIDECNSTVERFRRDQAGIVGELMSINKETHEQFKLLCSRIFKLEEAAQQNSDSVQQQNELIDSIKRRNIELEKSMSHIKAELERSSKSTSDRAGKEFKDAGCQSDLVSPRHSYHKSSAPLQDSTRLTDLKQLHQEQDMLISEMQKNQNAHSASLERIDQDIQKLRQQLLRNKGPLDEHLPDLNACKNLPPRVLSVEQELSVLFERISHIDELKLSMCSALDQSLKQQLKSVRVDLDSRVDSVDRECASSLEDLRRCTKSTFDQLVEEYNQNFMEVENNQLEVMTLTKQIVGVTSLLAKKLGELSSSKLDTSALETFFEYINVRIRQTTELRTLRHNRSLSQLQENASEQDIPNGKLQELHNRLPSRSQLGSGNRNALITVL